MSNPKEEYIKRQNEIQKKINPNHNEIIDSVIDSHNKQSPDAKIIADEKEIDLEYKEFDWADEVESQVDSEIPNKQVINEVDSKKLTNKEL